MDTHDQDVLERPAPADALPQDLDPDPAAVEQLLGQVVADLAATGSAGVVVIGNRLGLYRALAEAPATPEELAGRTGLDARYLTEWLRNQAAGGYVGHDAATGRFRLTAAQAFLLADPAGPDLSSAFRAVVGYLRSEPLVTAAFRTGEGVGWHEHHDDVFLGTDAFYRPGYAGALLQTWLPAMDGVVDRLTQGALVADVGCGLGSTSLMVAEAFPRSTVVGSDYHAPSVDEARRRAEEAGLADRLAFEVATAASFSGDGFDLVMTFDALHDMGDPVAAARRVREALAPDGAWLVVEPFAPESVEDTFTTLGRLFYAGSLFLCVPNALSQPGGHALGAQAGERAVRAVAAEAGFSRVRVVHTGPVNVAYEIRS